MDKKVVYPVLESKIAERGIRKTTIANKLGIKARTLYNKMTGAGQFTWREVLIIQNSFFPDVPKDVLMQTTPNDLFTPTDRTA